MRFGKLRDEFAVGIIDNDKRQVKYLEEFEEIDKVEGSLILWKHKNKSHFIIQICPALEKWILNICESEGINLNELGLSSELETLKYYTKSLSGIKDEKLLKLFKRINSLVNNSSVKKLKNWIELLKEKNYQVDINDLING
jgi:hypothetical protein